MTPSHVTLWRPTAQAALNIVFTAGSHFNISLWETLSQVLIPPYLHLSGIPRVLDRLDPADVGDAAVKERAGLANKHTQSQRRPVRLCRREREKEEGEPRGRRRRWIRQMMYSPRKHGGEKRGSEWNEIGGKRRVIERRGWESLIIKRSSKLKVQLINTKSADARAVKAQ